MENLHTDVLENILFRLPADAAIQAKRVCTTWREIFRNKAEKPGGFLFAHAVGDHHDCNHKLRQLFYEDESDHYQTSDKRFMIEIEYGKSIRNSVSNHFMVGSCNGLVCFGRDINIKLCDRALFLICNPLTGESVFLPELNYSEWPRHTLRKRGRLASGFGYCPSTGEYKVVTIFYCEHEQLGGYVHVYTVGGGWRCVQYNYQCAFNYLSGIYANGALFWLHQSTNYKVQESEIVAFDLEGEKFHYIALPRSEGFKYSSCNFPLKLLAGNNNLYLVHSIMEACRTDIWVYRRDNRKTRKSSRWLMEFSIQMDFPRYFEAFAITRSNAVLWIYKKGNSLYWYDPKTSTINKLWDDKSNGMEPVYIEAIPHTQSNVSLKDLGETNVTLFERFWPSFQG